MRVICITEPSVSFLSISKQPTPTMKLGIGNEYTVDGEYTYEGRLFYFLSEYSSSSPRKAFSASLFALISDIDERELVTNKEEYV